MAEILLSAFSDEYSRDIDKQIEMLSKEGIKYIEPRFIGEKSISDLSYSEAKELKRKLDACDITSFKLNNKGILHFIV